MSDTILARGVAAPPIEWDGALSDLETKADTVSLEGLHIIRRNLINDNATLIARYGNFGMHDDFRKSRVEAQKIRARMELSAGRDKKPTESEIDAAAYGSEEYGKFLDNALAEKIEYLRIQVAVDEINEQIRSRELALVAFAAEVRLAR